MFNTCKWPEFKIILIKSAFFQEMRVKIMKIREDQTINVIQQFIT